MTFYWTRIISGIGTNTSLAVYFNPPAFSETSYYDIKSTKAKTYTALKNAAHLFKPTTNKGLHISQSRLNSGTVATRSSSDPDETRVHDVLRTCDRVTVGNIRGSRGVH